MKKIPEIVKRLIRYSPLDAINYIEKELGFQEFIKNGETKEINGIKALMIFAI
ncbi:hypothetical protein AAHH67_24390 [Niallia circulans]